MAIGRAHSPQCDECAHVISILRLERARERKRTPSKERSCAERPFARMVSQVHPARAYEGVRHGIHVRHVCLAFRERAELTPARSKERVLSACVSPVVGGKSTC